MSEETEYDFKRTSAQIENLLDKIPAEGVVAKVYNTTLDLNGIHRRANKAATHAEVEEVLNIINKYNAGYLVTIADTRDYPFRYGVVSVGMMDDANPITLIHYDDVGDVIAFMLDAPYEGAMWTVTNKTETKIYKTKLSLGDIEIRTNKAMTQAEYDEVYTIIDKYKNGYVVTIADESTQQYRYGTIAVSMQDDAVPTRLLFYDNAGNLIAFSIDDLRVGALWNIENKTFKANDLKICVLTTPKLLDVTRTDIIELNDTDNEVLNSHYKDQSYDKILLTYLNSSEEIYNIPLTFYTKVGELFCVSFINPKDSHIYKILIGRANDGKHNASAAIVPDAVKSSFLFSFYYNLASKTASCPCAISSNIPFLLKSEITYVISSTTYKCYVSSILCLTNGSAYVTLPTYNTNLNTYSDASIAVSIEGGTLKFTVAISGTLTSYTVTNTEILYI